MKLEDLEYYIENSIKLSENLNCGIFLNCVSFNLIFKNNIYEVQLSNKITIFSNDSLSLKNHEMKIIILYEKDNIIKIIKNKKEFLLTKDEQIIKNIIE